MKLIDYIRESFAPAKDVEKPLTEAQILFNNYSEPIMNVPFTGELTYGDMGAPIDYYPEYQQLAIRSWQAYLTSEIAMTTMRNYVVWTVGAGLKLQSEPNKDVLQSEGIGITDDQIDKFTNVTDARFKVYSESRMSTYDRTMNLSIFSQEVEKHAKVGGDCLVVLRYSKNKGLNSQLINGLHVQSPPQDEEYYEQAKKRGNQIVHGIELHPTGAHVAFYVKVVGNKFKRIPARNRALDKTQAFLVYGSRYRVDEVRGLPLLSVVLQAIKGLERYKDATLSSAEKRAEIVYQVVHGSTSTGETPISQQLANANRLGEATAPETSLNNSCEEIATKVAATTKNEAYNMPVDSELKTLEAKNELYFKDFFSVNSEIVFAALGIPPEIALGKFTSSFSSSRMGGKMWEHMTKYNRYMLSFYLMRPIHSFWLETEILSNKIQAPEYLSSVMSGNWMATEAYKTCRFIGPAIPHVDPEKEARAARVRLGKSNENIPISDLEQETENLNAGDWQENIKRMAKQVDLAKSMIPEPTTVNNNNNQQT